MLSVRIPTVGEILVDLATMFLSGATIYLRGKDEAKNPCTVICSRISWNDDYSYDYGWAHIIGYMVNGEHTACNHYASIG